MSQVPFSDRELAARVEDAEAALCAAVARPIAGAAITPIGGGVSVYARAGSPVNKLVGLGLGAPLDEEELGRLEAAWQVRAEVATLADPAIPRLLSERGYRLEGFEHVLGAPLPAPRGREPGAGIEIALAEDGVAWGAVMIEAFLCPDETSGDAETHARQAVEEVHADLERAHGFHRYLASVDGTLVGAATLFVHQGIALLAGAATLPEHRRRGVQTALLARRLADAAAAGCELACVTTAPGTRSQANAQRAGFGLLYARAILVAPPRS